MTRRDRGIRFNSIVNAIGGALPLGVSLVTVPLYLHVIGQDRYGVLLLVWTLLGYFGAFDMGISRATANQIAQMNESSVAERATVVWTALTLGVAFGLVGALLMIGAGSVLLDSVVKLPSHFRTETAAALPWLAVAVPLSNVFWLLIGSLEGQQRFLVSNALSVVSVVLAQLVPLGFAALFGANLTWTVGATSLAGLLSTLCALAICWKTVPLVASRAFDRSLARALSGYGAWVMITQIAVPIIATVDRFAVGAVAGVRAVTYYGIPANMVNRVSILPSSLSRTLFPRFSMLAHGDASLLQRRAVLALGQLMAPVVVAAMLLLEPFLTVWVGAPLARRGAPVGEILLLGLWASSLASVPYTYLQGQRRPDLPAKFHLLELPVYLAVLWGALSVWGIRGAAWSSSSLAGVNALLLFTAARARWADYRPLLLPGATILGAYLVVAAGPDDTALRASIGCALLVTALLAAVPVLRQLVPIALRRHAPGASPILDPEPAHRDALGAGLPAASRVTRP